MKKVTFFAAFLFVMVCGLMANPVDMEKARLVADRYVRASGLYDKQQKENRVVDITTKTQYTQFYVFRIVGTRSGKGFILVSGDDCGRPVLAYSATSDFMTQEMPDHVADWLKAYELQLQEARQKGMKAPDYIRRQWDWLTDKSGLLHDNTTETAALVTTHWDQMPYYNNLCPMDNAQETRALTGCVATAMAQIMKYWERPVNGIGSHSYTHATYGMQSADFGSTNYSWNDMPVQLSSTSTAAEVEAVSLLMYHCGVAVDMNYSPSGSGAQTIGSRAGAATAENALRNYFDYSPSLYGVYKSDYSDNVWKQLLMAELDARRPMIYRGEGGMGGHCFICDGYDSDTNFHFNFGWSGSNDGFYALSAVGQGNYTFTTSQGAILGIQPANTTGASPQELVISHIDTAGAMLAWVDMNSPAATAFTVVCAPVAAFDTANSTFFRTSTQPRLQLTDLATATRYRVAVRAHCADTVSPWSTVLEFTTALAPQPLPLAVSFDGGIPAGWEQEQPNGTVTWRTSVGGHGGSPSAPLSGSTNAFLYSDSRGCVSRLLTPLMDITSAAGRGTLVAKMAFGHTQAQWDSDIDQLYVYYRTAPSEEWTLLTAYTQAISNWQRDTLLLPEPSATYQVAFEGRLHWGHGICVDDVAFFSERQEDPVAAATTPYSCSFGDDTENANWVLLNGTDTNRWVIGYAVNSGNNNMGALYISSDEGLSNFYLTNEASTVFAYRDITLTAGQYAYSYDWYAMGETGRDYMRVALVPSTVTLTGGTLGAWSENTLPTGALAMDGGHWLSGVATWQTANDVVDVPTSGNYRIVMLWHNDDRYGDQMPAAIDNLTFEENTCVLPTQLTFTSITSTGAVLTWQAGGSENRWELTVNGTTHTVSTTPTFTFTGLQPNTDYQVELRSVCGNTRSLAARRTTFHTTCANQSLPYSYGFEDATIGAGSEMPTCWTRISATSFPYVVQNNPHGGSRALYFNNQLQYAVLPAFDIADISTMKVGFWARKVANGAISVVVGMMTNPNDATTFVPVDTVDNITVSYARYEVNMGSYNGTGSYPALMVPATGANYLYIDDINVSACTYVVTAQTPLTETFEAVTSVTRNCWTQETVNGNLAWTFRQGGNSNYPSTSHSGTNNAYFYGTTNQRNYKTRLVSPILNTSSMNTVRMSFWHAQAKWSGDQDTLQVYYRQAPSQPWQLLAVYSDDITAWTLHELYMLGSDSMQVAFLGIARNGRGVVLDDITFDEAPYCGEVLSLSAQLTDTINSTARLTWNGSLGTGAYFRLEYGPQGFTPGNGTVVNNITTTSFDVPYLGVGITYDFYVTTICNSVQQSARVMTSLYVPAVVDTTMPYYTSFDNASDVTRWVLLNGSQTNQWTIGTATGNYTTNGGALYITNNNGTDNTYDNASASSVFAYRALRLRAGNYTYRYDWRTYGESSYDYLRVALVPDTTTLLPGSATGWTATALPDEALSLDGNSRLNLQNNWQSREGRFMIETEGVYHLVFFWRNDGNTGTQPPAAIDNITIDRLPDMDVVTELPYQCDFSDILENARWTLANGTQTNQWVLGSAAGSYPTGSNALYISNNNGSDNAYTLGSTTNVYAYRTFLLDSGSYEFSYSWRSNGEVGNNGTHYDYLRVAMMPATITPVAGSTGNWTATSVPSGYTSIDGDGPLDNHTEWQQAYGRFEIAEEGLYHMVFFWHNDNSSGTQPPAAVDNIVLQPSGEACGTVSNLVTTAVQDTSVTLSWNGTGNLYRIEYGPANFVPGTGTLLNNIPTRAYTVTGLTPATNYDFYVSIVCGQLPLGASPLRITVATRSQIEGLPYVCDFSDANENANWTLLNGTQTNKWFIGTATGNGDSRALYISNDNGVNNNYTLTATSTVFAYRPFHLDAGRYAYSYDWKTVGETSYDFIRAVVVPSTINLSAGNASGFGYNTLPNGAVALDGGEQLVGSADWRTVTGTFDITATGDYYLLFYWRNDNSTGTQPPAAIDNVMLQSDDCEMPSELAVAAIDDGSVTFTWFTSMGSAWQVSCGSLVDTVYTRRATFTGLQSNTTYRLFVRTLCEDGMSGCATLEVHTPCAARALPYSYGFEDATAAGRNGQINACWLKGTDVPSTAGYPYPSNTYSHGDGLYSMYMASSNTYSSYLVLPLFDNPVNRTVLTFWARPNSTTTSYPLEIGVVTNPVDISTFELVETYVIPNATVDWYKDTVLFDTYQGTGRFIAIRLQGGTARYCYLDDFTVEVMPECSGVTDIAVASTTESSIQLTWHETGPATSWMVEYGPEGFVPGAGTAMAVQDTVVTITGLANNTYYDFYIHSDCGHATSIARRITAQTDCGRMSIPFMETFDSYRGNATDPIDHCWYKVYRQGNTLNQQSYPQFTIQGSNTYLSFYSNTNNYSYLALPLMEGNIHDQMLRFKMRSSGTAQAVIRVGVMTDATNYSTFQQVSQVTNTSGNWETYTVPFNSRTGTSYRIALLSPAQNQTNQPLVDDIEVLTIPACSSPTNFMVTNITATGARLTWMAPTGITYFRVVYRPYGDYDQSYEVTVDSLQGTSYTITGLQAGTTYEAEVYSYCVSDEESFSLGATTTFSTSCTAFPIPFSESFDRCIASNAAPIGPCWYKRYASNNSQNSYPFPTITNAKYDGDKTLVFYGGNGNNAYSYLVLPELSGTLSQMQISLKLHTPNRTSSMIVGVISDPSDINTFQQVQTLTTTSTTEWQSFTVPFTSVSATNVRIAIRQATNAQQASNVYLDDILVESIPVCNGPARVTVDRVLYDRVRVHWPASTLAGATYTVEYGPAGFTLGQGTRLTGLTDTLVNLTGLTSTSAYTVYVQASCSSTSQSALVSNTFTTGCLEQVPYSYGFEVLTSNGNTTNVPCWVLGNNARVYRSSTQSNYAAEGTCRLQFSISGTGNSAYAVMPKLSENLSNVYMTLKYMSTAGSSNLLCPLQVGIMTDPYDFSTFTAVSTLTPTAATWEPFRVDFGGQSGDGYIAFYAINNQYVPTVAIDDIHVYRVTPHQINLTVTEPTRGTVSINGVATNSAQVLSGSTVTLAATPNYGYSFGHWTAGVTANPYVFTMPDRDVTYNNISFVKNAYTVTASANNDILGTVTGGGSYDYLDTATLVAMPYAGYLFIQWNDGSTANPRRIVVSRDTALTAQFSVDCITLEVSIDSTVCESLTWNGTTYTGSGTYAHQDTTIWGCDSITTLHLTVLHGTHNVEYDTTDYDIYVWNGTTYTATGVYSYQYINDAGCASADTLHLVIDPTRPVLVDETHPFHDDFERGNCWRLLNGTVTNKWYVGSATSNGGTKSLYISNNNGVANEYGTNNSSTVFAAKTFTLTAGHHYFSYDWRCFGESTYDYMRVALAPASANLTPGTSTYSGISTTQLPSGWITLDGGTKKNLSNGWQSYVAEATVTTAGNYQMVFYWRNDNLQGTQPPAAVDNVSIIKSNCARPTDVAASNITSTTATLTWSGSVGNYMVAYGTTTSIEDMDTLTATGTTLQLSNLSPSASYRVYVKSVCSATDQSPWSELYIFTTACGPMTSLPYTQGFEESTTGSNTFEVNCWSRHTSAGSYPYVSSTSTYVHSGSNGLYWYATSSYTQYLVLPEMNTTVHPINTLRMKFWAKANSGTTQPAFLVGVMTDPDDLNTFTVVATVNVSGTTWNEYTANLGNYTGAGSYIAVRAQATSTWAVYLDDFTLEEMPSCPEPTGVGTTTVTHNSAMLSWLGTGASSYTVAYGMGTDVNTMDTLRVYTTTATLTNLNPGSEYHAYVRANCEDEQSAWTQIYTFRTQCGQISVLPYTEDFNTSTTGSATFGVNCWQRISSATYPYVYASAGRNGNGLYWNYPATAGAYQYAVLPAIDVTQHPISTLRLTFWARSVNNTYHPRIEVGVMSNPLDISTFTLLRGVDIEGVTWTEHNIDLNAYSGNGQNIALRGANTSGSQWYAYLDDFTVDVAPACVDPYDVAVANVTATTATFSWQGSAQSYTVAYGIDTVPSAMTMRTTTSTTLALSGLLPNTEYHVFVRSECSGGSHSEWTPMYTFHTECMAIAALPYTEGFEDYDAGNINTATFPVDCWRRFTNGTNYYVPVISTQAHTGRRALQWYLYNYASYGTSQYVVMPSIEVPGQTLSNMMLTFWARTSSSTTVGSFQVGVMSNPNDTNTFVLVDNVTVTGTAWTEHTTLLSSYSGSGTHIAVRSRNTTTSGIAYVDDFTVDAIPLCYSPTNLATSSITDNSATVTWSGTATSYRVAYGTGTDPAQMDSIDVTGNSINLTGLIQNMTYNVYVRALCTYSISPWSQMLTFRAACGTIPSVVTTDTACESYTWHGTTYTTTNSYTFDTLIDGCPRIDTLYLTVYYGTHNSTAETACDSYTWHETPYTSTGLYTYNYTNAMGCASTDTLHLTVNYATTGDTFATACEHFTWYDSSYTSSTSVTRTTVNAAGCDSVTTLHLTINRATTGDTTAVACERFTWYESSYTSSTSATRTIANVAGCDSVVTLHLTVNYGTYNSQTETVNESYTWHETTYTATGLYTYNYTNDDGCPSTDTLHLTVDPYMPILVNETHPFSDGFEGNILHWQLFNGTQTNQWFRGTAAHSNGDNALYISNNNGTSNAYTTTNSPATAFATKKFILPAGHFYFSYDWRCMAENDYDYLRVYLTPANTTFTAGTLPTGVSTTGTPAGWTVLDRGRQMNMSSSWGNYAAEVNITDSAIYQVVFLWYNDSYTGTQPPAAIDEVTFVKSDCVRPANVAVQDVSMNTATLSWTGTAGSYQVAYGTTSALSEMDTVTVVGNTATLTGLAHTTTHYVYVRALCSDTDPSAWSAVLSFRTACGPVALPYNYGFEDASRSGSNGTINECWHKGSSAPNSSNYPYPYNYYSHEGNYSMYMVAEASYYSYVVLPQFDTTLSRTQLTFWGRAVSSSYASTVEIGVVTNPTDISTFQPYTTFEIPRTGVLQWHCDTVMFDSYQGNGRHIAIRLQGGGNARCYLDDFTVEAMPECSGVRNIAVVASTDTSITLSWHETGAATSWGVEYGPQGFIQGSGTLVTVTDTTATITGLTNNTWYDFYIHSDCVHATSRVQSIGAQTDCGRMAIPFYEGFSGYIYNNDPINRCWYKRYSQNSNQNSYPQFTSFNGDMCLHFYSNRNYYSYLVLPQMQGNIHDQMVRFKIRGDGSNWASLYVGVMTDATNYSTFQQVDGFNTTTMEWNTVSVPFNNLSGTNYRIAIVSPTLSYEPNVNAYSCYVDDIEVIPIPDCMPPEYLNVNNYTDTSVSLVWSTVPGVTYYRVVYMPHGDYDSTYRVIVDSVTGTTLTLTGLRMGTRYDVEVYSYCVTGELSDPVTSPFSTLCTAHSVPFTENFDQYTALTQAFSPCWSNGFYGAANTTTYPVTNSAYGKYDGDKVLLFYSSSNNMYSYAILPTLDDTLSLLQFKLQARTGNGNNPNISLQIGSVSSSANITTFQLAQSIDVSGTWQNYTVPLTSITDNSRRLAIRFQPNPGQGQSGNVLVDDIIVERIPACDGPARVTVDHIVYNGAHVHWPAVAGVASYTLEYGPSGFALGQGTQVTGITDTAYSLTGLTPGTAYSVYLSAACNSWSQSSLVTTSFSTGCLEELPYSYGFENLTTAVNGTVSTVPCWLLNENAQVQNNRNTTGYAAEGYARMRFSINRLTAYAVMPKLNERIENLYMTLQVNTPDTYFDEPREPLQVGVMTDPYDLSTFTAVASLMPTRADQWQSFRVNFDNLTGDNYYIAFYATSTSAYVYNVYFDDIQVIRIAPHNIDLTLADSTRGTVSINGVATTHAQALSGSNVTLTATANHGYTFSHWAAGVTDNPYTFVMPDHDVAYNHIVFSLNTYTVTALSNDTTLGTVIGGGRYDYLDTATLTATGIGIHTFLRWSDGVTDNPRTLVVTDDTTFTALFQNNCPTPVDTTVTVCDSYTWHGTEYNASGLYTFDHSTDQCTLVDTLRLTVNYSTHDSYSQSACDEYTWHGTRYTASNDYTYDYTNTEGCASTDTLHLTVNRSTTGDTTAVACDSFDWHGTTYTESGIFNSQFSILNSQGCDSTVTLVLTINRSTHNVLRQTVCDSYTWHDTSYTASGIYAYNYTNEAGCASLDTLHLTVNYSTASVDTQTACDSYRWFNGVTYTTSTNTPTVTLTNWIGCDSVVTLNLTVNHHSTVELHRTVCDSIVWHGSTYTYGGTYYYDTLNVEGCDSLTTLILTVNHSTHDNYYQNSCDSYVWNGTTYVTSGIYTYDYTNTEGCVSTDTLHLVIDQHTDTAFYVTACDGYRWNDSLYTQTGIYTYNYSQAGSTCTNVDTLYLTINNSAAVTVVDTACDSYTWHDSTYLYPYPDGYTYPYTSVYTYATTTVAGCDSVETLNLTLKRSTTGADIVTACDQYTWIDGITYTASSSNTSNYTLDAANGCDSVVTLFLTLNHSNTGDTAAVACDSFTWYDSSYTRSTRVTRVFTNAAGCDSTVTLALTVNRSTHNVLRQTVCDSYTWHDAPYTTSGVYTYDYTNEVGCVSVDTLHLTVKYSTTGVDTQMACDSYRWINGVTYTASTNTPTFNLTNRAGCDSLVTLNLTVNYNSASTLSWDVCDSLVWHGNTYTYSGTYYYDTLTAEGCDSLTTLMLTVNHGTHDNYYQNACDSYVWHDSSYTVSGTYTYDYTNTENCASTDTLHLMVEPHASTAYHVEACDSYRWNDSVYTESGVYTYDYSLAGSTCTNVDTLYLTINNSAAVTVVDTACDSYRWNDSTYYYSGVYTYPTTTMAGCDSVVTLNLTLKHSTTGADIVTACDQYTWINGITYTLNNNNTSDYTLVGSNGCDSVVTLYLTLNRSTAGDTAAVACDSFDWYGTSYTSTTSATRVTTNAAGCDSTVTLHLTVNHSTTGDTAAVACDSFTWYDSSYTSSTSATRTFTNAAGCDSTVTLYLTVNHSTTGDTAAVACDRFTWYDSSYTSSTSATRTFTNADGCDSIVTLALTINHSVATEVYDTACESYIWHDNPITSAIYSESGDYSYTTTTTAGCDSTVTLHLTVNHGTHNNYYQHACDTFTWHGTEYTLTGIYLYEYTNADGCASVDTLHLTVDQHSDTAYHVTLCDSVYRWNDSVYTESGVYIYDYSLTGSTCTNVDTLYLTLHSPADIHIWDTACDSYNWAGTVIPEGDWYRESGTYTRNLQTVYGCDSTVTLHLTIHHRSELDTTLMACDTLFWTVDGTTFTITESGDYSVVGQYYWTDINPNVLELGHRFPNVAGCDSTQELHVTIHHSTTGDTTAVACDSFTWYGTTYTESGTFNSQFTIHNSQGCDSIVTLHLTVNHSSIGDTAAEVCDSFTWYGTTYTESGIINSQSSILNSQGCDSVVTLYLTVNHGIYTATYQAACDSFLWHDSLYTLSGSYLYNYLTPEGCASVDTLVLTLSNGTSTAYHVDACDGYIWNGQRYTETGNYIYDYSALGGDCQNVDTLYLTIHHSYSLVYYDTACDSYTWSQNDVYTRSGTYYHSLTTAYGCDSLETLYLTLHYNTSTAYFDTIDEGDVYTWPVNGENYTAEGTYRYDYLSPDGCPSTDTLYLYVRHQIPVYHTLHARVNDTTMGYVIVYPDSVALEGGMVYVIPVPHEGYRFVSWANGDTLQIQAVTLWNDTTLTAVFDRALGVPEVDVLSDLTVYPNPTTGFVTLSVDNVTRIEVYDNRGRRLQAEENSTTIDLTPLPTGVYMLRITTPQGTTVRRVMKR